MSNLHNSRFQSESADQEGFTPRTWLYRLRSKKLVHQYQAIWMENGSPLLCLSQKLTDKIQLNLGENYLIKLAMRHS